MRYTYNILVFCFFLFITSAIRSQSFEPIRIELSARIDVPSYHIESLGEQGLLLFYESNEINENQKRKWYFSLLDTTLTEKWVQIVPLTDGMSFHSSKTNPDKVVMLFTLNNKSKDQSVNYEVITYNNIAQQFNLIGGNIPDKATFAGFSSNGNSALMAINLPKSKSDFLYFDLLKGLVISIANPTEGDVAVIDLATVNNGSLYIATISQAIDNELLKYHFIVFDNTGSIIGNYLHEDTKPRSLHSFTFEYDPISAALIIVGSFNDDKLKNNKPVQHEVEDIEATGLFYLNFSKNSKEQSNFVEFNDFKNIYKALAAEDLMEVRQKLSRSNDEKPVKPDIAFNLFNPVLVRFDDRLVFAAEAFRPQYRLESRIEYDFYGRPIPFTYSVFEGYNFFTTMIAAFNKTGGLSWTYNVEIPEFVTFYLQPHVLIQADSSSLVCCVINNGLINSSVIGSDGIEIGSTEQSKIASDFANDRLMEENFSSVIHWYSNYYIGSGYQKIANNKLRDNNPRTVFYINKLGFN